MRRPSWPWLQQTACKQSRCPEANQGPAQSERTRITISGSQVRENTSGEDTSVGILQRSQCYQP
eukprot:90974-Rhodomonas_salina.1